MECRDVKSRLSEYIDGMLEDDESSLVRAHVETCLDCAKTYASMTRLIGFMRETESVDEPADFLDSVRTKLDRRSSPGDFVRRWFGAPVTRMPLKAAAVALVVVLLVHLPGDLRDRSPQEFQLPSDAEKRIEITTDDSRGRRDEPEPASKENAVGETMRRQPVEEPAETDKLAGTVGDETGVAKAAGAGAGVFEEKPARAGRDEEVLAEVGLYEDESGGAGAGDAEGIESDYDRAKDRIISRNAEIPLREVVQAMAGTVIESEYDEDKNRVVALVVEIPEDNYDAFIEELDRLEEVTLDQLEEVMLDRPASPREQAEPVKSAPAAKSTEPVLRTESTRAARALMPSDSTNSLQTTKSDTPATAGKAAELEESEKTKKRADQKRTVTVRIYLR